VLSSIPTSSIRLPAIPRPVTTGHERPLGQRGAAMADTVGAAASEASMKRIF
jgi:hypothetical protein